MFNHYLGRVKKIRVLMTGEECIVFALQTALGFQVARVTN